jgi:hypothetical protein
VCWKSTRASLWLLCNVHFVQITQRTHLQTRPFVCGINNLLKQSVCYKLLLEITYFTVEELIVTVIVKLCKIKHLRRLKVEVVI